MLGCGSKEPKQQSCGQDAGETWWLWRQVDPSTFAYSTMTVMDVNETHVSLGVVYEGTTGLRWTVVTDFLPQVGAGA